MRFSYFDPLIGLVLPTLLSGYGAMIPQSGIAGLNELTIGFALLRSRCCDCCTFLRHRPVSSAAQRLRSPAPLPR